MQNDFTNDSDFEIVPIHKTFVSPSKKSLKDSTYKPKHFAPTHPLDTNMREGVQDSGFDVLQEPENQEIVEVQNEGEASVKELLFVIILAFVVALGIRTFIAEPYRVPTGSMLQTIQLNDMLVGEKVTLHFSDPHPGEVITFTDPDNKDQILIKRVIAVAGQVVDIRSGNLYIDGQKQDEPYVGSNKTEPIDSWAGCLTGPVLYPYTVPEGCVWVMGDNREHSADSRYFGAVNLDSVIARAKFIFWPVRDISKL